MSDYEGIIFSMLYDILNPKVYDRVTALEEKAIEEGRETREVMAEKYAFRSVPDDPAILVQQVVTTELIRMIKNDKLYRNYIDRQKPRQEVLG